MVKKESMFDLLHYCVRCNELSNVIEPNVFVCSVCGYSWKIIEYK